MYASKPPTVVLMAGLQGAGKTTNAAKLGRWFKQQGRNPLLVGADLQRPAAIDQLEQLGRQIQIPVYRLDTKDPVEVVKHGLDAAREAGNDVVIVDTAGRLQIDEALMEELGRVRDAAKPDSKVASLIHPGHPRAPRRPGGVTPSASARWGVSARPHPPR